MPASPVLRLQNYEASVQIKQSYKTTAMYALAIISLVLLFDFLRPGQKLLTLLPPIAVVGFVGYTLFQRNGTINPHLLVISYLAMVGFIGLVLDFRNLRDMFLSLLPPIAGGAMMIGIMALLKMNLNPANLIVLPLVLGIGVDDGVHVLHDYRRQMKAGRDEFLISASTINAILLTTLTSMVGFGSLMIASHQGLFTVGPDTADRSWMLWIHFTDPTASDPPHGWQFLRRRGNHRNPGIGSPTQEA